MERFVSSHRSAGPTVFDRRNSLPITCPLSWISSRAPSPNSRASSPPPSIGRARRWRSSSPRRNSSWRKKSEASLDAYRGTRRGPRRRDPRRERGPRLRRARHDEDVAHLPHTALERPERVPRPVCLPRARSSELDRPYGGPRLPARRHVREFERLRPRHASEEADRIRGTTVAGPVQALHARHPQVVRLPLPRPRLTRCARDPREVPRAATGNVFPDPLASGPQVHGVPPRGTADGPYGRSGSSPRRVRQTQGRLSGGRNLAPPARSPGGVRDAATVAGRQDARAPARHGLPRAHLRQRLPGHRRIRVISRGL